MLRVSPRRVAAVAALAALALAVDAQGYQTAPGWTASDYVTGFSFDAAGRGPSGLAFDSQGNLFVTAMGSGTLHKVPPGGGTAASTKLRDYGGGAGLAFDKSGRLYMAGTYRHNIVELNPASGDVIRTVVDGLPCPDEIAVDPISGDLFVSNVFCAGGGIMRVTGFANGPGVATRYAGDQDADGITFGPDGTLYAAAANSVVRISGTNSSSPRTARPMATVPTVDGLAYAPATPTSDAFLMALRNDGEIDRVGMDGSVTPVLTGGSRGDVLTVGPDKCIYGDLQDRVIKLAPSNGTCAFSPEAGPAAGGEQGGGNQVGASTAVDTAVKALSPRRVLRGRLFELEVKVSDLSANRANTPSFNFTLPKGTKFVRLRHNKTVSCKRHARTISCSQRALDGGKSFSVRVVVRALRGSRYTSTVRARSQDVDPQPANNKSVSRTQVMRH
jgi:uncharacterized protein DUF11